MLHIANYIIKKKQLYDFSLHLHQLSSIILCIKVCIKITKNLPKNE